MVSGAVIIGRPAGPGMFRPFTTSDFRDLRNCCNLALIADGPVEVAYPFVLASSDRYRYCEGVLVNVRGNGDGESVEEFRKDIEDRLIFAAQRAEEIYCREVQNGRKPWESDLGYEKICVTTSDDSKECIKWTPYMEIVETYPESEQKKHYLRIASDLILKTGKARKKRFEEKQQEWARRSVEMIANLKI